MSWHTGREVAGLPDGGPVTLAILKVHVGLASDDDEHDDRLNMIVDAVNAQVRGYPIAEKVAGASEWPADVVYGAGMLAARLFRRKDNIDGVMVFGDTGAMYVRRNDPDVARLLELGDAQRPKAR